MIIVVWVRILLYCVFILLFLMEKNDRKGISIFLIVLRRLFYMKTPGFLSHTSDFFLKFLTSLKKFKECKMNSYSLKETIRKRREIHRKK